MAATDTTHVARGVGALPCARVGCSDPATASFAFDSSSRLVWLDPLTGPNQGAGLLCARHADLLTPPWGWNLQDRRSPTPRLWADRPAPERTLARAPVADARRTREPRTRPRTAATRLPFDDPVPAPPADPSLERVLDARTPLLARAFEGARSPHERAVSGLDAPSS